MSDGTISWRQLWDETAALHGRPQARWLCEEASGAFGDEFRDVLQRPATERQVAHLDAMLARLLAGEPLQYVLGHWSFRTLDLLVDRRVLIPRPETELVVGAAIEHARALLGRFPDRPLPMADLGTGSGAIGLSLAAELPRGAVEVWLTDVSADALDVARANAAGLGIAGAGVRFGEGSWFAALPSELVGALALVVSNPPYIAHDDPRVEPSVRGWEPAAALFAGPDGLADVRTIAAAAATWLRPNGRLVVEVGSGQGAEAAAILSAAGLGEVEVLPDLAGHDRIATAVRD
ncbi:MAG: peptide chain release factor N(5)-glutamine methyltransferase [Actinomycetota bacterium]|nr:peptide chain release factor N(5)-glutamine methyltransferase [Actinomycetota bacterium]